jgi:hypothetical protein
MGAVLNTMGPKALDSRDADKISSTAKEGNEDVFRDQMGYKNLGGPKSPDSKTDNKSLDAAKKLWELAKKIASLTDKYDALKAKIDKVVSAYLSIRWGKLSLALLDSLGAEMLAAVSSIGGSMADALIKKAMNADLFRGLSLSDIASSAKRLMSAVIESIMKIFLDAGDSIFSLVKMPLDQARDAAEREHRHLIAAQNDLNIVIAIIRKWLEGSGGDFYYKKMKSALPFLFGASNGLESLIANLRREGNATFNASVFISVQNSLTQAARITSPTDGILDKLGITQLKDEEKRKRKEPRRVVINKKYDDNRKLIDAGRIHDISKANSDIDYIDKKKVDTENKAKGTQSAENAFGNTAKQRALTAIDARWAFDVDTNERRRKSAIAQMEADVDFEVEVDKEFLGRALRGAANAKRKEFEHDMTTIKKSLKSYLENLKTAFVAYTQCKALSSAVYNIRTMIRYLVSQIIDLSRSIGNDGADDIADLFEVSKSLVDSTKDRFVASTTRYEQGDKTSSMMQIDLTIGNTQIRLANVMMSAMVASTLDALFNSDDVLEGHAQEFNEFLRRMRVDIPKWSKKDKLAWVESPVDDKATIPYAKLLLNAGLALSTIPLLSISNDKDSKEKLNVIVNEIKDDMAQVISHNRRVISVLNSYEPPPSKMGDELQKVLGKLDMTSTFCATFGLGVIASGIAVMSLSEKDIIKAANGGAYPAGLSAADASTGVFGFLMMSRNASLSDTTSKSQAHDEAKDKDREKTRTEVSTESPLSEFSSKELLYPDPAV